jgi:hypothetical protein
MSIDPGRVHQAHDRRHPRFLLSNALSLGRIEPSHLALDVAQLAEELQRVFTHLAAMVGPQLVELAPRLRHTAHFGHAQLETGFV